MRIRTKADLNDLRDESWRALKHGLPAVWVGMASCGIAAGAEAVYERARELIVERGLSASLYKTGCIGYCQREPLVEVRSPDGERVLYGPVGPRDIEKLLEQCVGEGEATDVPRVGGVPPMSFSAPMLEDVLSWRPDHPFYAGQFRVASRNCGHFDPENMHHAVATGAYQALARCLLTMTPEEVIQEVIASGLRGRGGAGYPTGRKWQFTAAAPGSDKYIICNADEGDPGAYMDRSLLEGDPHAVVEGMLIGAYATGAQSGVIFVRTEYPLAIMRLRQALQDARSFGILGQRILGTDFSFRLNIVEGAGAFVSGEETALIAAVEGRIAEPRPRPPYPAAQGLYGEPTVINNVETWANIPVIIQQGGEQFARLGTEQSKGTKVFSLVGAVQNTGLVEVELGTPLRTIVETIGGGARAWRELKAVQTGGPSGGCIPAERFDLPVDYETLAAEGSIMGSGGLVVMDDASCMVDIARYFIEFTSCESCGKCTPCREGLSHMLEILRRITEGRGRPQDLERLEELAAGIQDASLCGLGKSAPNPVLTTLRHFRHEYQVHIDDRRCPAGVCRELVTYYLDPEFCTGCAACAKVCPSEAISGEKDSVHSLDRELCIKCGACREVCTYDAIRVV